MGETKSTGLAAVLSFLFPGLGQIYNGQFGKAAAFIVLAIVFVFLSFFLIGIPLFLALWIFGMYDAYKGAERFNDTHQTRQCMRCGAQIPMNLNMCPHCGNPVPGYPWAPSQPGAIASPPYQQPQPPPPTQQPQFQPLPPTNPGSAPTAAVGGFCIRCGSALAPAASFCSACGAPVQR